MHIKIVADDGAAGILFRSAAQRPPLATYRKGEAALRDRYLLKEFLEYTHMKKGLLEPYDADYPLVEPRELLPSFEKNFAEYNHLPSFSMVAFNRPLSYQEEIFQFDLLHPRTTASAGPAGKTWTKSSPPGPGAPVRVQGAFRLPGSHRSDLL